MDGSVCKAIIPDASPEISASKREVTSYKSVFGNVDRAREIVEPGAFLASIGPGSRLAKGLVPTRHNHETLVGKMIHAEEDRVGLLTTDKYGTDPVSDRVFSLVRDNILTTSSFKATFRKESRVKKTGADGQPVYHLLALNLQEAGPADPDFAVNDATRVVSVKGLQEVASTLASLAGLESQEVWTLDSLKQLSPEDKDALMAILASMPHGMACEAILAEMQSEAASGDGYEAAAGKAAQLSDVIEEWKIGQLNSRLQQINRRLSAAN